MDHREQELYKTYINLCKHLYKILQRKKNNTGTRQGHLTDRRFRRRFDI